MQSTQSRPGRASDYFQQKADLIRRQLHDAEALLVERRRFAENWSRSGRIVPADVNARLNDSVRKVQILKKEMQRALFNSGRT